MKVSNHFRCDAAIADHQFHRWLVYRHLIGSFMQIYIFNNYCNPTSDNLFSCMYMWYIVGISGVSDLCECDVDLSSIASYALSCIQTMRR
jgi:hypothetical protein